MSGLRIYSADNGGDLKSTDNHAEIARELGDVGVRFQRWEASQPGVPGARQDGGITP